MAMEKECRARQSLIDACRAMNTSGLNQGTAGNLSLRWKNGLLITPSGRPYDELQPDDIVFMNMEGSFEHELAPSSEWRMHRDILSARADVGAVVHAHSVHATAFAICGMEIPAVHYMIAIAGGPTIRCAPYATYGTQELSARVLEALEGRSCALMANHGMVATGADLRQAMWLAVEVEALCKQYALALQIGTPQLLSDEEVAKNVAKFNDYGLKKKPRAA
jgi:L-fuculose-phosphate aldolase